jgi:hypothetical protein
MLCLGALAAIQISANVWVTFARRHCDGFLTCTLTGSWVNDLRVISSSFAIFPRFFHRMLVAAATGSLLRTDRKFYWAEGKRPPNLVLIKNLHGYTFDKQMAGNAMCVFNNGDGDKWSVRKVMVLVFQGSGRSGRYSPCYQPLVSGEWIPNSHCPLSRVLRPFPFLWGTSIQFPVPRGPYMHPEVLLMRKRVEAQEDPHQT